MRGFERNELGPVVYVVRDAVHVGQQPAGRSIPTRCGSRPTGGNTLAVGNVELRVPSPVFSSRLRLAAFVDAGTLLAAAGGELAAAHPGDARASASGSRRRSGPARLDVAYNPYKLQPGALFQVDADGHAHPGAGPGLLRARPAAARFTFHFAVGQPF